MTGYAHARRPAGRHRREPARAPGGHARHRGVPQGRPVRRVVRHLQPADHHLRRHARVRARPRPRVAGHDPPRRRARPRLRAATVPRICVVLRKAYGGAYIVMDSRGIGNDLCVAWPGAEIAVMGAPARGADPHGKRLRALDAKTGAGRARLVTEYEAEFENPYRAAERGYVDAVIEPADDPPRARATRSRCSRPSATRQPARRHSQHSALRGTRGTHAARRQTHPGHRRAQRRVDRVLRRAAGPGGGRARSCSRRSGAR